jgi:hypothetical protein
MDEIVCKSMRSTRYAAAELGVRKSRYTVVSKSPDQPVELLCPVSTLATAVSSGRRRKQPRECTILFYSNQLLDSTRCLSIRAALTIVVLAEDHTSRSQRATVRGW